MQAERATIDVPDIMSVHQLSVFLSIPVPTLYRLARSGKLPGRKIGRQWRFSRAAIAEWLYCRESEKGE